MKKITFRKSNTRNNSGYTLVELMVTMTITAIFATAVVAVLPSATRVYTHIQDVSRAQMVADMVVDSLREECADTYIEDYASARIINLTAGSDDTDLVGFSSWGGESAVDFNDPGDKGNVLIIRKSNGYCEAIYSELPISSDNRQSVWDKDDSPNKNSYLGNHYASRAVYRLFEDGTATEAAAGYVHFGYYKNAFAESAPVLSNPLDPTQTTTTTIKCIYPYERYDYTTPFTASSYNGYTVDITFSNLTYSSFGGDYAIYKRPSGVDVTVTVYKYGYSDWSEANALYTRTARLVFAEDTTDK